MKQKRTQVKIIVIVCVTIAITLLVYFRLRPKSMIDHAKNIAYATYRGDTNQLFDYMLPEDSKITGITRQAFVDAYRLLIAPRFKPFNTLVSEETELEGVGDEGVCELVVKTKSGVTFQIAALPFLADDGPGAFDQPDMFGRLLQLSWLADYAIERNGYPVTNLGKWKIFLRELDHDAPTLRTLGIKGFISHKVVGNGFTDLKLITWDEYRRRLVKTIARLEKETTGPSQPQPNAEPTPLPTSG